MGRRSVSVVQPARRSARSDFGLTTVVFPILLVIASLLVRLLWLEADAAPSLSWSGALFTDEGLYSHAARNAVLFGTWRADEWDPRLVSPLHSGLVYAVFQSVGVGYLQLRIVSVLLSMIALGLFWRVLRRDFGERVGALAVALWGLDYFWFQYSRLGFLEPGLVLWLVVAAWSWRRSLDGHRRWALLAGAAAALAWVWKSLALIFAPAPLLALLLLSGSKDGSEGGLQRSWLGAWYLAGFGAVTLAYTLLWYLPQGSELTVYNQFYADDRIPRSVEELGQALWDNLRSPYIWGQTPVIAVAAALGLLRAIRDWRERALPPVAALSCTWLLCGLSLLVMPYSPPRYYTLLLPPLVCLACYVVAFTDNRYSRRLPLVAQGALLTASLLWSGTWYTRWASARQTTLPEASQALGRLLAPGEVVVGISACGLSLRNELRCVPPIVGLANDGDPVARFGARYALVETNPNDYMRRFHRGLLARSTRIKTFPFGAQQVTLYRLADE